MLRRDPRLDLAYSYAASLYGLEEIAGSEHNQLIVDFHKTTWYDDYRDEVPWCSSFMNWCIKGAGLPNTQSPRARSWLEWGQPTTTPVKGDICVLTRTGGGHVGFVHAICGDWVCLLGGNQSDRVSYEDYKRSRVLDFRTIYVNLAFPNGDGAIT